MISILMTTYNGEDFVCAQIDSLLNQTNQNFILYVRDDCSTDGTMVILRHYAEKFPGKIVLTQTPMNTGSAKHNFWQLMVENKDDYIMLCDQDDVWMPEKIEITLKKMKELEDLYTQDEPLLVHTDLQVVDKDLKLISPSFRQSMNANYKKVSFNSLLVQNTLTGCTAMYNRALAELLVETPSYMVMHDWFLMLVAGAFGHISDIERPTILYRQHARNSIGAKDVRTLKYKVGRLINYKSIRRALAETYDQAQSFLDIYRSKLSSDQVLLLETYCTVPEMNKFSRWNTVCRLGILKNGITRKIANFIFI